MSTTIAVDVAKSVFEIALSHRPGRVAKRDRLSRGQFARFLATHPPATVLMEACGMAHFWGRHAEASGHRVVLLPPHAASPALGVARDPHGSRLSPTRHSASGNHRLRAHPRQAPRRSKLSGETPSDPGGV